MAPSKIAKPDSWKTLPLPTARADLGFSASCTPTGICTNPAGDSFPQELGIGFIYCMIIMAIFTAADRHRHLRVRFCDQREAMPPSNESWVSRDPAQYKESALDYDRAPAGILIDAFLPGKNVRFGSRPVSTGAPLRVYQHLPSSAESSHRFHHQIVQNINQITRVQLSLKIQINAFSDPINQISFTKQ